MKTYTVVFDDHGNWTFFQDGADIPLHWHIWSIGLSWEQAFTSVNG